MGSYFNLVEAVGNKNEDVTIEDEEETYVSDGGLDDILLAYLQDLMDAGTMSGKRVWKHLSAGTWRCTSLEISFKCLFRQFSEL